MLIWQGKGNDCTIGSVQKSVAGVGMSDFATYQNGSVGCKVLYAFWVTLLHESAAKLHSDAICALT